MGKRTSDNYDEAAAACAVVDGASPLERAAASLTREDLELNRRWAALGAACRAFAAEKAAKKARRAARAARPSKPRAGRETLGEADSEPAAPPADPPADAAVVVVPEPLFPNAPLPPAVACAVASPAGPAEFPRTVPLVLGGRIARDVVKALRVLHAARDRWLAGGAYTLLSRPTTNKTSYGEMVDRLSDRSRRAKT